MPGDKSSTAKGGVGVGELARQCTSVWEGLEDIIFGSLGEKDGFEEYDSKVDPAGVVTWHFCEQKYNKDQLGDGKHKDKEGEMEWDAMTPNTRHRGPPSTTGQAKSSGTNKRNRAAPQSQASLRGSERSTTPLGSPLGTSRVRFSHPQTAVAGQNMRSPSKRAVTPYPSPKRADSLPSSQELEMESPTHPNDNEV